MRVGGDRDFSGHIDSQMMSSVCIGIVGIPGIDELPFLVEGAK